MDQLNDASDKWQELYLQAQSKKSKDKQDKDVDEIIMEKNPDEFTF